MESFKDTAKTKEERSKLLAFKRLVLKSQIYEDAELPDQIDIDELEHLSDEEIEEVIKYSNKLIGKEYYKCTKKVG